MHSTVPCTFRSHALVLCALEKFAETTNSCICKSVDYVGDFYGDIDLVELPDSALHYVHKYLKIELGDIDPVVVAIRETIEERRKFRFSLPGRILISAILRDRIRTQLEKEFGGKLYKNSVYKWASHRNAVDQLQWLIEEMFQPFDRWRDRPDRALIVRGCLDADRIV